ncbi:Transcriptional regulator of acetoin/glycerol metabolism [Paracoccus laeviglucosivorans]|uniref:Transcriptional regulator of acetoin/glycerol metabolism n=2 Tax=Paracoccus laeviglucosivorans TaxID=1197861 RepID=A0A521CXJ3_9RHOB|nr:Transcriptional regulator of acetoin/glycerol metabolism [Paracoccus laeviglucosivorans]
MDADLHHIREIEAVSQGVMATRDPVVVESWLRCIEKHRLDPAVRAQAYILPDNQLREHRQRSEELIGIARSGIENLYSLVAGQNYVLMLADRAGVTVEYLGDETQKAELRRSGLYLGAEWSEARAGTCALGACIEAGEALIIHQSDHFDVTHGGLSCTAAPIYDTRGQLSAVLDISLLSSPRPRTSQSLALNLVRQSARRIEMANIMAESRSDWVLRLSGSADFLDVDPEAAISMDGAGCVIGMTHAAARLMARAAGIDWRQAGLLIGRPVSDFLNVRLDRLDDLTRQRPAPERLIETRDGHRLFAHAIEPRRLPSRNPVPIARAVPLPAALRELAGDDPAMAQLLNRAAGLARAALPVLIEGETGTGKLTLARAMHDAGRSGAFIVLRCAELSDTDEALVFGRMDGRRHEEGLIDQVGRGTLVLDKVNELPPRLQSRLLQLASEGSYLPVGGIRPILPGLRLIATAQGDLAACVQSGAFRRDLYHCLAGSALRLPPLRDRRDLFWLIDRILARAYAEPVLLSPEVLTPLAAHQWPGNLRELSGFAASLAAVAQGPNVTLSDLPMTMAAPTERSGGAALLARTLHETGGNISETARRMGVDRTTIHRRMRRLGLHAGASTH